MAGPQHGQGTPQRPAFMTGGRNEFLIWAFGRYRGPLHSFLSAMLKSDDDADDVVQETFLRVRRLERPEDLERPKGFLFTTAYRLALDLLRRRKRSSIAENYDLDESVLPHPSVSIEDQVSARQELHILCEALESLSPNCRQAFVLRKFFDLPYRDIAAEIGITVSTVEKHVAKAVNHCADQLEQQHTIKLSRSDVHPMSIRTRIER